VTVFLSRLSRSTKVMTSSGVRGTSRVLNALTPK
jgi:hypothetical protein